MIENDISKCRICFLDGKTGASLYNDENSTSYGAMIKDFTGFDLTQNDNLSSLICDSCISELTIVIEFITKVKTSYERFKYFNNIDDSWEKNDTYSINEDDNLPISFISAGVFTPIKDEQESKMIGGIKQESADDKDLSFDNPFPSESNGVFCLNADEEDSPKADIFNSEKLDSTFEDTIADRRQQKTPLIIEQHIENHSRSKDISRVKSVFSKTDGIHKKQPILTVVTSKEPSFKKDKLKSSASIVPKRKHTGERPYPCTCCKKQYIQLTSFHSHMRTLHPEEWMKMPASQENEDIRNIEIEDTRNIEIEEIKNIEIVKYNRNDEECVSCEFCDKSYENKEELITHLQIHTNEKRFYCYYCSRTFHLYTTFRKHVIASHTIEGQYTCHVCRRSFPTLNKLYSHSASHRTVKKLVCEYCGKSYTRKGTLITHIRIHTNEKPYACSYCPKTFRLYPSFKIHVRAIHTMERPYCCHVCGKSFPSSNRLRAHVRRHNAERKFQCNICNDFFKSKCYLKIHIKCMHSAKSKICHICDTAFSLTYNLNQHIKRRHPGQQNLESTSVGLTDAGRSTENIFVQCEVCKKPFSNLEKHMKQHTDEQPFGCDFCHKRFFQRKNLLQHVKKHQN